MKSYFLIFFSLLFSYGAFAIDFETSGGVYTYSIKNATKKTIKLSSYTDYGETISLKIPSEISEGDDTYSVVELSFLTSTQCLVQPGSQIENIYIPSSVTKVGVITRDLTTLKYAIFENGDNIPYFNLIPFYYYNTNIPVEYIIAFNNSNSNITPEKLFGSFNKSKYLKISLSINYYDNDNPETVSMILYYVRNEHSTFDNTTFGFLISALEKRGVDLYTISSIDFKNASLNFTYILDQDAANLLPAGAKIILRNGDIITSTNIPDKVDFTAPSSDITGTINYTRSNTLNWNSVCLPFDIKESDFGGNSKIYEVTSASSDAITLSRVATSETTIPAGTPCFIKSTDEQWDLTISDATISSSVSAQSITVGNYQVVGSFELKTIGANNYKLTADGSKFGITNKDDATVTPFRCYITPPSSNNAPAFINVNFDEEATITLIPNDAEPQKVKLYDLLGRPRKEASPGIFIKSTR